MSQAGLPDGGLRSGCLVVVVGPSGAGKDTLLDLAAEHFAARQDVCFVRRTITRDGASGNEDHRAVTDDEFQALKAEGAFAIDWAAHGLRYGIPADVHDRLAKGHLVIVNGSRSALSQFRTSFDRLKIVNITARPDVLATRLELRGRESREEIEKRLQRSILTVVGDYDLVEIDNSGTLGSARQQMIDVLEDLLREAASH